MNLLEIRKKFRDLSGRYDLVNEDGSDRGATFFINAGIKWLDNNVMDKDIFYLYSSEGVQVYGVYKSTELVLDVDDNFWIREHPILVCKAAMRETFVTSGNKTMKDVMENDLVSTLVALDKNLIDYTSRHATQMRG